MPYNAPNELSYLSNKQLLKMKKRMTIAFSVTTAIVLLSYVSTFLIDKSYRNLTIIIIPMMLISPIFFNLKGLRDVKRELKLREQWTYNTPMLNILESRNSYPALQSFSNFIFTTTTRQAAIIGNKFIQIAVH